MAELKQAAGILVQLLEANNLVPVKYRRKFIMDVLPLVKEVNIHVWIFFFEMNL
jgi:hypothetical protein